MALVHHAATQNDALRRQTTDQIDRGQRQVVSLQGPRRMVFRQALGGLAPARLQGRAAGQPLQAVAVEGTHAREGIGRQVVRQAHVPHFGVHQTVQQRAAGHPTAADAGADGQIEEGIQVPGRPPAVLAQGRAVDVGLKADRNIQRPPHRAGQIGVGPTRLGRGGNKAVGGRSRLQIDRPEGGDAHRCQPVPVRPQELDGALNRFAGRGRGELDLRLEVIRSRAHSTDEGRAARFDAPEHRVLSHLLVLPAQVYHILRLPAMNKRGCSKPPRTSSLTKGSAARFTWQSAPDSPRQAARTVLVSTGI